MSKARHFPVLGTDDGWTATEAFNTHGHSELQNLGPLEAVGDLVRRHSWMQGDRKTNNRCPYNHKMEAANRATWPHARECLGEARSESEGRKAVFSRNQGSMASLTARCSASTTHSCHIKPNSVWPVCSSTLVQAPWVSSVRHGRQLPGAQGQQSSRHMTPSSKDLSLPPGTATFLL